MSNLLNSYHPFRAKTTHEMTHAPQQSADNSSQNNSGESNAAEQEEQRFLNPKTKARILVGICAAIALYFVGVSTVDAVGSWFSKGKVKADSGISQDPSEDWAYQGDVRNVEDARESVGFFQSLFCKGGRRSTFCR